MASPDLDIYFRVDITFKALSEDTEEQTKTLSFIDRPYPEASTQYIAALLDLTGLGIGVGQSGMPVQSVGSIVLNDGPGSLGFERRVSDLLVRYTVANQPIYIYASQVAIGEAPSFELIWSGTGVNANKSAGAEESLTINCKGVSIPVRPVLRAIQDDECSSATQNSIGRFPAMPIGSYAAMAELFEDGWPCFAFPVNSLSSGAGFINGYSNWASRFVTSYGPHVAEVSGTIAWARCDDGKYRKIKNGNISTALFPSNTTGSNYPSVSDGDERCFLLGSHGPTERYIITGGRFLFRGQNNGGITPTGNIFFKLYVGKYLGGDTRPDVVSVASAIVDKATYLSSVRGASDFYVEFTFSEPFVYGGDAPGAIGLHSLSLSWAVENFATTVTDFVPGGVVSAGDFFVRDSSTNDWTDVTGTYLPYGNVYAVEWSSYPHGPNSDGLYFYSTDLTQRSPATGQTLIDLNQLELLMGGLGIIDDSLGTVTGNALGSITLPEHVLESLSYKWTGTSWMSDAGFNWNTYSVAYQSVFGLYPRSIVGSITQEGTSEDVMAAIVGQHRLNLIQDSLGTISAWPVGYTPSVAFVIDSEDSIITGWGILDPETVVNHVRMFYAENFLNSNNPNETSQDGFESYALSADFSIKLPSIHSIGAQSQALYGKRELGAQAYNLVGEAITASNIGSLIYRQFDLPHWIVSLTIPFWKYRTLRPMDVIEITSPALPAYFGTSEAGNNPIYDGDYVEAAYGEYPKRAQRYRCQILQKNLEYQAGTVPTWALTVRIISPYHPNEVT